MPLSVASRRGGRGVLQDLHVDLPHLEHRVQRALAARRVRVAQEFAHPVRDDLPAEAEPVLQPAAGSRLAAVGSQRVPEAVDLLLVLAVDRERDGLGERELRPAVDRIELHARELEEHERHVVPARRAVDVIDARHLRVLEQRDVEVGGLLGLGVVPE
jgi:hypothetical protein